MAKNEDDREKSQRVNRVAKREKTEKVKLEHKGEERENKEKEIRLAKRKTTEKTHIITDIECIFLRHLSTIITTSSDWI